jgi:phage tail sheath protein FI
MRMLIKIKRDLRKSGMVFIFEINDQITRDALKLMVDGYLADIMARRGLYDFVTLCDATNNTPVRIDRNEMWCDIALKPAKAVEFLYIPIRVLSTGAPMPNNT